MELKISNGINDNGFLLDRQGPPDVDLEHFAERATSATEADG